jgi:hypothetical protein
MRALGTLWRALSLVAAGIAVLGMLLMLVGTVTVEWTCQESGGTWKCVGAECSAEATKRFDKYRRRVSCERTDWPMVILARAADLVLPKQRDQSSQSGA